jgi:calpain-7
MQEAERRILLSSTKDDALANAISATELYIKAIKFANSEQESKRLKKKCMLLLARAEEIKRTSDWTPVGKADPQPFTLNRQLRDPQSRGALPNREEVILLEGSRLHGSIFPPWDREPDENEFHLCGQELYM